MSDKPLLTEELKKLIAELKREELKKLIAELITEE